MIGGVKEIAGGALQGISGQMGGAGKTEGSNKSGGEQKSKEQQLMQQAQKLAQENDLGTLQEALSDKDGGGEKTGQAGKGNQKASSIAGSYDKEVIEKAIEIREQQDAQKQQGQQVGGIQQDKATISPDAKAGGGAGGTIPQAQALKGLA